MQQEVERPEVGQLVALDRALDHALEVPRDPRCRHLLHENRIVLGLERDEPHVSGIALVARAGVGELEQADPFCVAFTDRPAARSDERTPTRSCTSGNSSSGARSSARRPWVASAPTNSVRIAPNPSPKSLRRCRNTRSAAVAFLYASGQAYTSVPTALYP